MATSPLLPAVQGPPLNDPLLGKQLGSYKIEKAVASGGMGIVYVARHVLLGRSVAIKVLRPEYAHNEEQTERFLKEAHAIAGIRHKGIVSVEDFGKLDDGRQYMVMEFLEGETLEGLLARDAPMHANRALPILDEVLDALSAAHKVGVVHRDLKPSNIFLVVQSNGAKYCKLVDFGLAQHSTFSSDQLPAFAKASLIAGTPEYVSPEQARGLVATARADIYCCGVILYEMLTGKLPFSAPSLMELLQQQVYQKAPRVSSSQAVSGSLDDLVAQMLEKDPDARPRSADVVRQAIARVLKEMKEESTQYVSRPAPLVKAGDQMGEPLLEDTKISGSKLDATQLSPPKERSDGRGKRVPPEILIPPPESKSDGRGRRAPVETPAGEVITNPAQAVTPKVDEQMERTHDGQSSGTNPLTMLQDTGRMPASQATLTVKRSEGARSRMLIALVVGLVAGSVGIWALVRGPSEVTRPPDEQPADPPPVPVVAAPPVKPRDVVKVEPPRPVPDPKPKPIAAVTPTATPVRPPKSEPVKIKPRQECFGDWRTEVLNRIHAASQARMQRLQNPGVERIEEVQKEDKELRSMLDQGNSPEACERVLLRLEGWKPK